MTDHATRAREIWKRITDDMQLAKRSGMTPRELAIYTDKMAPEYITAALDLAAQEATRFVAQEKDTLLQEFCNLQVLYGEQKHTIRALQAAQPVWSENKPDVAGVWFYRERKGSRVKVYELDEHEIKATGYSWKGEWAKAMLPREA